MTKLRDMPIKLPGATLFSGDSELDNPIWSVETLLKHPQFSDDLLEATSLEKSGGRPRQAGSWALAFLAFTGSRSQHLKPWWGQTTDQTWQACGFLARPPFPTVWERFAELENHPEAFEEAAQKLIQHARRHEPLIGQDIHIDGTEAETNARLIHDCQPGETCQRGATAPVQQPTSVVRDERHILTEGLPPSEAEDFGDGREYKKDTEGARIKVGGCFYRTRDQTAGIRAYAGRRAVRKFWHGFYNHKAIDHYTGAPVAVRVVSASQQEHHSYPDVLKHAIDAVGETPRAVIADRGFSTQAVFEHNTRQGIASVIPWRKTKQEMTRRDYDEFDRHGVPRCRHCGGESLFHRFESNTRLRISFRCAAPQTNDCQKIQSISPSANWRLLIPLWRTEAAYLALRDSHSEYERVHQHWRDRYCVGADNKSSRPRRPGAQWQQLRASAALLIEWLRICSREGWLGSSRRNTHSAVVRDAEDKRDRFRSTRRLQGLDLPYGIIAERLGIGQADPPSARGKP